jgi:hypothetical protein
MASACQEKTSSLDRKIEKFNATSSVSLFRFLDGQYVRSDLHLLLGHRCVLEQVHASSQQIPRGSPLGLIRIGDGKVATPKQQGDLVRVDFIVFCFATVLCFA